MREAREKLQGPHNASIGCGSATGFSAWGGSQDPNEVVREGGRDGVSVSGRNMVIFYVFLCQLYT